MRHGDVVINAGQEPLQSTSQPEAGELGKDTGRRESHRIIRIAQDALSTESNEDTAVLQRGSRD